MTCRQAQIGSAITSYVLHSTDLEEQQVLSLYHEVMREGRSSEAPTPDTNTVRLLAANLVETITRDTTLTEARRNSLHRRLVRAADETIDGSRHYATLRLMERARRAEIAMHEYVAATARDTGLTEAEVRTCLNEDRARAGSDRSIRPSAGFVNAMRNDPTTSDLPLDRQTAVAIEALERLRARSRAAQPTRPTVTRQPVVGSRAVAEMGYDEATGRAEVVLRSNPDVAYAYRMTQDEWDAFVNAPSWGSYYATEIRGNDAYRYADDTSAREAGTQTRCATCGEFAATDHACAPRGSEQEREQTEQRARAAARRPRRRVITPSEAEQAAAEAPEQAPAERVARRRVVVPEDPTPTRIGGTRRAYTGQSGYFRTPGLTGVLAEARRNPAGVRIPVTAGIAAVSGPDGPVTGLHSGGSRGVVSGHVRITYNGRGRGYTVTNERGQADGVVDNSTAVDRLRCNCPDYQRNYDCMHIRQTVQDITTRINADSLRTYHMYGPAITTVNGELAEDYAQSQAAQTTSRATWEANPTYTNDHAAFQTDYRAAKARIEAGENPIPYMTENATDGLGAPRTGRAFGVELEFVIPSGVNRAEALRAIGRDLHAAGLTRTASQQRYHSSSTYSRSHQGGWKFEQDCTVDGEIISPIMHDTPETWEAIAKVCEIVERHGGTVDRRAGSHVHVGAGNYDHTVENHNRLLASFAENEDLMYRLSTNPTSSNSNRRHRGPSWCAPNNVPSSGYRDVSHAQRSNNSHNLGLNMQSVSGRSSDHVEFRTFDGTLTPSVIQTQIKLALGMTESAFRDTDYQPGSPNPLGSHRSHNRSAHGSSRRLTGEDWRNDVAGYKALADRLFRRPEDKAQMTALFAWTTWQRRR